MEPFSSIKIGTETIFISFVAFKSYHFVSPSSLKTVKSSFEVGKMIGSYFVDVMQSKIIQSLYYIHRVTSSPLADLTRKAKALCIISSREPSSMQAS